MGVVFPPYAEGEHRERRGGRHRVGCGLCQGEPLDGDVVGRSPQHQGADGNHHHPVEDADDAVPFKEHQPLEIAAQIEDE